MSLDGFPQKTIHLLESICLIVAKKCVIAIENSRRQRVDNIIIVDTTDRPTDAETTDIEIHNYGQDFIFPCNIRGRHGFSTHYNYK